MTSLQNKVDAVKAAITPTTTCTSATTVLLKDLLITESDHHTSSLPPSTTTTTTTASSNAASKPTRGASARPKTPSTTRQRAPTTTTTTTKPTAARQPKPENDLSSKEKAALATHLEAGMSSFVTKLLGLGLQDHALRELAVLKRSLAQLDAAKPSTKTDKAVAAASHANTLATNPAHLLDYGAIKASGAILGLVITSQLHALRLVAAAKKPAMIEAAVPFLGDHPSSPMNLLSRYAKESAAAKNKAARQLEQFSQLILSLPPSVSSKEDALAAENRLSCSPTAALQLHSLGFEYRLCWWAMAGHEADVDGDLMLPLSRCMAAFVRRCATPTPAAFQVARGAYTRITDLCAHQRLQPSTSAASPLAAIYQTLGTLAQSARLFTEAATWLTLVKGHLDPEQSSAAKRCSVAAQLLAVQAKREDTPTQELESLLQEIIGELKGTLKGDSAELEELMINLTAARRSTVGLLVHKESSLPRPMTASCHDFVLQFPHFALRWMGKAPARDADAKHTIRYDQRRQTLLATATQIMDSAFVVLKAKISKDDMPWAQLDGTLQDCLTLLEHLGETNLLQKSDGANTYPVKVSSLYYYHADRVQRGGGTEKEDGKAVLRPIKRSIEAVADRSPREKERAQLVKKLERFSELSRASGRLAEARDARKAICTNMVEDGVLAAVAASLNDKAPALAWRADAKTEALSRTLAAMVKLDQAWSDWTFFLAELERAAVLEHLIQIIVSDAAKGSGGSSSSSKPTGLSSSVPDALLRLYSLERFPVRRLRTLCLLLAMSMGEQHEFQSLRVQVNATLDACRSSAFGDDASLAKFLPHHEAHLASMIALIDTDPASATNDLEAPVAAWRAMIARCTSVDDMYACIDDPEQLLRHLGSVEAFANLRGDDVLRLAVLELSTDLTRLMTSSSINTVLLSHSALADHYLDLGHEAKAKDMLARAALLATPDESEAGPLSGSEVAWVSLQLSSVEYHLAAHNHVEAEAALAEAKAAFDKQTTPPKGSSLQRRLLLARATYVYSLVAMGKGETHQALNYAKNNVKLLYSSWAKLEARSPAASHESSQLSIATSSADEDDGGSSLQKSTTGSSSSSSSILHVADGPDYWALACALLRSMFHLSSVYVHIGMFQETLYYAEKALSIAESIDSLAHKTQAQSWIGSVWIRANKPEKGLNLLQRARETLGSQKPSRRAMRLACELSASYGLLKDRQSEEELFGTAEAMLKTLGGAGVVGGSANDDVVEKMQKLTLDDAATATKTARAARTTRATRTTRTAAAAPKAAAKKPTTTATRTRAAAPKTRTAAAADVAPKATPKSPALQTSMLISKALVHLDKKDWAAAMELLDESQKTSVGLRQSLTVQVHRAACLIGQSLEEMLHDSVFSVVQESTISFPAVAAIAGTDKHAADKAAAASPPARKSRARAATLQKDARPDTSFGFVESLQKALEYLVEAHSMAFVTGDGHLVLRISALLQNTTIFLSAASNHTAKSLPHIDFATCSMELARNVTWRRTRKMIAVEQSDAPFSDISWPTALALKEGRRLSCGVTTDVARFQRDYVNIIPAAWSVVSISLSENRHDLCITKLQADHTPFVLRLPLERAVSRDADTEVFDFEQGHGELLEVIRLINESCHDEGRDWSAKGAKAAWWQEREALDKRMKQLLDNIEQIWLGGFKGIFSQHPRRDDLLSRFQKAFQKTLDKHLPSRRQVRGKKVNTAPKITLDPRILDLFVGLGDPASPDFDLDEALTDLLYFVVDILQFHGERNAYDEIDFDSIMLETYDALQAYHAGLKSSDPVQGAHTILILDKALHAFPWESLPCMDGLAVSRVPSMACLRRLILEQQDDAVAGEKTPAGHTISAKKGTYILNPGSDLPNTLGTFQKPLSTLDATWSSVVSRTPSEAEFEAALRDSDVLLYFGHGSGAQYIRSKTIRRLDKCRAAALLMGCSSASLTEAGEFEVHGPVWNYMMAGCPAVVGTLWDVTDRDIDRFAGRLFEEWGLMVRGSFPVDKWSAGPANLDVVATRSVVEAVVKARDAVRFRYLTAGAVCVYGIPVYVRPDTR
ncbi:Lysine-specific histone demethylase 1A [Verticillium dahliae VDG2]|nr:Lysine-specific histone demethylase 1A [Verticillium dahliae VDG2]